MATRMYIAMTNDVRKNDSHMTFFQYSYMYCTITCDEIFEILNCKKSIE